MAATLKILSKKEQFVPAEYTLLRQWYPILEKEAKGIVGYYLVLQTFVNRQEGNSRYGKAWPSVDTLVKLCASSPVYLRKLNNILAKYGFISIESGKELGVSNQYTILPLPEPPELAGVYNKDGKSLEDVFVEGHEEAESRLKEAIERSKAKAEEILAGLMNKKKVSAWNVHDMIKFYKNYHVLKLDAKANDKIGGREIKHVKDLIEGYGAETTKLGIEYAIDNWEDMDYVTGYPSIVSIFGYRNSIFPEAQAGKLVSSKRGQYRGKEKGEFEW